MEPTDAEMTPVIGNEEDSNPPIREEEIKNESTDEFSTETESDQSKEESDCEEGRTRAKKRKNVQMDASMPSGEQEPSSEGNENVMSTAATVKGILDKANQPGPSEGVNRLIVAKKGCVEKGSVYKATRLCDTLEPEDPGMKTFNLANFKKTTTNAQMKFMLQKVSDLIMSQFDKMLMPLSTQADMVAFFIKNFQKGNIFAAVDHVTFFAEDNQVKLESVVTRDFKLPKKRIVKWAEKVGIPKGTDIVTSQKADRSISEEPDHSDEDSEANTLDSVPDLDNDDEESNHQASQKSAIEANSQGELMTMLKTVMNDCQDLKDKNAALECAYSSLESKMNLVQETLIPDLKQRVKGVKKLIPSDSTLPNTNKVAIESVRAGLERARAKVAILEQAIPEKKFKLAPNDVAALFASTKANEWAREKIAAERSTPIFRSTVKEIAGQVANTHQLSMMNFTDQMKTQIATWCKNLIDADLVEMCGAKSELLVQELREQILAILPEQGEIAFTEEKEEKKMSPALQQALIVMQKQITESKSTGKEVAIDSAFEMAIVTSIFANPANSASKVLEYLKVWSVIQPERQTELENAAKNILNFQGTKAYLTLLDFDTALIQSLGMQATVAFRSLQTELQDAMDKPAHEIRMDPSDSSLTGWNLSQWKQYRFTPQATSSKVNIEDVEVPSRTEQSTSADADAQSEMQMLRQQMPELYNLFPARFQE